jgi:hypothetical protein
VVVVVLLPLLPLLLLLLLPPPLLAEWRPALALAIGEGAGDSGGLARRQFLCAKRLLSAAPVGLASGGSGDLRTSLRPPTAPPCAPRAPSAGDRGWGATTRSARRVDQVCGACHVGRGRGRQASWQAASVREFSGEDGVRYGAAARRSARTTLGVVLARQREVGAAGIAATATAPRPLAAAWGRV